MNRTQTGRPTEGATALRLTQPTELAALGEFFAGLSLQSRYLRFFAPVTPSQTVLRRMAGGPGTSDAIVAQKGGLIIGHAMAVDHAEPGGERVTDIGVVVADGWQGQGVGSALVRELIRRAQARGVTSVVMDVLRANHRVLGMITRHWAAPRVEHSADFLTIRAPLSRRHQRSPRPTVPAHHSRSSRISQDRRAASVIS